MKLQSSFSSSSSSSSSSSFSSSAVTTITTCVDGNIHTSKSSAVGCISGMVRRLLCRNSLPTYPCDQLKLHTRLGSFEDVELECLKKENQDETSSAAAAPGLVARLMGLESLPQVITPGGGGGGHDQKSSPNSISRSRSMNSVDALKEIASIQGKNHRVKSFREVPNFVEDEEFLILSFENEDKKIKTKQSKVETGSRGKKNNKRRKSVYDDKNKENQEPDSNASSENFLGKILINESTLKGSSNIHPFCAENSLAQIRMEKTSEIEKDENEKNVKIPTGKTRDDDDCFPVKKIEAECDISENSSPNSVLDATVFPSDSQITHSAGENSKTRRTLSEELQNYRKLNFIDTKSFKKTESEKNGDDVKFRDPNNPMFVKILGDIRKLVEKEEATESESVWTYKRIEKLDDGKEQILGEMELEILDEMVDVLVNELCR